MKGYKPFDELESELRQRSPGPHHRYMQDFVKHLGRKKGFRASDEKTVLDGKGRVDVVLERGDLSIAVEISVTTGARHEIQNMNKCLAAGYSYVVLLSSNEQRLAMARVLMDGEEEERTRFFTPTQFIGFLDELTPAKKKPETPTVAQATPTQSGKGRVLVDTDDAARYLGLAKQTLAKFRVSGESPPYYKIGRRVLYDRADLDEWLANRRRRSTSDGAQRVGRSDPKSLVRILKAS